jgi:hypothetical protein
VKLLQIKKFYSDFRLWIEMARSVENFSQLHLSIRLYFLGLEIIVSWLFLVESVFLVSSF